MLLNNRENKPSSLTACDMRESGWGKREVSIDMYLSYNTFSNFKYQYPNAILWLIIHIRLHLSGAIHLHIC